MIATSIIQRLDQDVRGKWLSKKSDAADFHGATFDGYIIIRSHEYDGDREARVYKVPRNFNTATLAKVNIDNEAHRFSHHRSIDELFSRSIEFCVVPECRQQTAHGAEDAEVIVDYRNNITLRWHELVVRSRAYGSDARRCGRLECRFELGFWWAPLYVGFACMSCYPVPKGCRRRPAATIEHKVVNDVDTKRLGTLPTATGGIARLAYACARDGLALS
jgi:hypothetical protein